jgi:hypothetical protein
MTIETFIAECLNTGQYSRKGEVTPSAKTLEKWVGELKDLNPKYFEVTLYLFELRILSKTWPKNFPEHIKSLYFICKQIDIRIQSDPPAEEVKAEPKAFWPKFLWSRLWRFNRLPEVGE